MQPDLIRARTHEDQPTRGDDPLDVKHDDGTAATSAHAEIAYANARRSAEHRKTPRGRG